jgi:hypothetical protein
MGLDMFAYSISVEEKNKISVASVDFDLEKTYECEDCTQFHSWRKHPNLHGWMRALYDKKGGQDDNFNCKAVVVDSDDLDRLESDVHDFKLPLTVGFFFGASTMEDEKDDFEFINKAHALIKQGRVVFYYAWW